MGTRTITDTLRYLVDPWASQSVVFTLLSPIASVDGLYLPRSLTATTDVTGAFSIALPVPDDADEAGTYTCLLPNGQTIPFPLSAGVGSVRLGSLFVEAISTASPNDLQVLIDNHAAVKASTTTSGHVTVDGTTITATNGVLSAAGGGGGAPTNAAYVTLSTNATLTGERVLTAGDNVTLTDNGAGGTVVIAAPSIPWGDVTSTPTTLAGYGITDAASDAELATHEADTTNVHGIANTATLVLTNDSRLSDARTPTAHASSHASGGGDAVTVAQSQVTSLVSDLAAKAPLASPALTGTPTAPTAVAGTSTTQVATTAFATGGLATHEADTTAVHGIANTAALLTTSTAAGGVLGGTYPNPTFAADMATQAELDVESAARTALATALNPVRVYADGGALLNIPRMLVTDAHALNAGVVKFIYLHNVPALAVTTFLTYCSTAASGTIAAKCGLYSVAGNGNLTCVARSASSSTLWKTNNTVFVPVVADDGAASPTPISSVTLTASGSYAIALLQTGATSDPVLGGKWGINNALMAFAPTIAASISGQTDLQPTYTAASLSTITSVPWAGVRA